MTETSEPLIIELIPPPSAVREQLAKNARERDLLKSLLKLSQRAQQCQKMGSRMTGEIVNV